MTAPMPVRDPVPQPSSQLLEVRGLSVSFQTPSGRVRVLDNIDLEVRDGEIVSLVGESGSGKSVAAMTCVGLTRYAGAVVEEGSIRFMGEEIVNASSRRLNRLRGGEVGFVFQEPMTSLNPAFTVGNQIGEVLRRHAGLSRKAVRPRAAELLDMVGLSDPTRRLDEYPHQLSGGMRQRVMIAMAIAGRPKLLIADEPTTALDVTVQATILDLLRDLRDELSMAVMLITHDLGVVAEVAERVVVMYAGQVVETADCGAIFNRPRHPYTSGLMTSLPQMSKPGEAFGSIPGVVPPPGEMPAGCRFHPRCPYCVRSRCAQDPIPMFEAEDSRVRCVRFDELFLEGT